ncbi:S-layer homology domain-containing protein [Paenibacillus sp. TRM 82003]|nr:S-layer homology domain-containing protein [Paenibacillus sp. TRM 82003]
MVYGNEGYVAVSQSKILVSADGEAWMHSYTSTNTLSAVSYGNGRYVAVGSNGAIETSGDGMTWTTGSTGFPEAFHSIAYGNGLFVAVGDNGRIVTSPDGAAWTIRPSGAIARLTEAAYLNGIFVAAGLSGTIVYSNDGMQWSSGRPGVTFDLSGVDAAHDRFIAYGNNTVLSSTDGVNWSQDALFGGEAFSDAGYGNGTYVLVGAGGLVRTSTDGRQWTRIRSGTTQSLSGVASSGTELFAVGNSSVVYASVDGREWMARPHNATSQLSAIAVGEGVYGAVGVASEMLISSDGENWQRSTSGTRYPLYGIAYGNGRFAAVGNNGLIVSTSAGGTDWTIRPTGMTSHLRGIAYGGGKFVAVGISGTVLTSTDGETWTSAASGVTQHLMGVTYGNGMFVAAGYGGTVITSADGAAWSPRDTGATATAIFTGAAYGNGTFAIAGNTLILTSEDGNAWTNRFSGSYAISGITYHRGTFVTVGNWGTILQSGSTYRSNANVAGIELSPATATLQPSFDPGTTSYNAYVERGETVLRVGAEDTEATVTVAVYNARNELALAPVDILGTQAGRDIALPPDADRINLAVVAQDGTTRKQYTVAVRRPSAEPTNVTAVAGDGQATVSFTPPTDDGGSPITGYEVTATPGGRTATGTGSPIAVGGLTNGTRYTFTVKAVNAAGESAPSAASNAIVPDSPSDSVPAAAPAPASEGAEVLVNGKPETMGVATTSQASGRAVITIAIDEKKLEERLSSAGARAVLTIPVADDADVVVGELNARMVKRMGTQEATLEIKTSTAAYTIPAVRIDVDDLAARFGKAVALEDIKIRVVIASPSAEAVEAAERAATEGGFEVVASPVEFKVEAVYEDIDVEVTEYTDYVERSVVLPEDVDPAKITTGVVVEANGTVRHVPTKVTEQEGRYVAQINSLTNSAYAVVWHPASFSDVLGHWSEEAVNDMGSRMIVGGAGDGRFFPDETITRAEFAAVLVRGLGLKPGVGAAPFADVSMDDWHNGYVDAAYAHGLLLGFEDGTFRPEDRLTREQAMAIADKAMALTGLKAKLTPYAVEETLRSLHDAEQISDWARAGVAAGLQAGVISGRGEGEAAPQAYMTRAEIATLMQKLLRRSDLI